MAYRADSFPHFLDLFHLLLFGFHSDLQTLWGANSVIVL